jgi:hypothetical protein
MGMAPPPSVNLKAPASEVTGLSHEADLKMQLEGMQNQLAFQQENLDELLRPLNEAMSSSRIRTELKHGESLVTGGYQLPNGNFLLCRLTPLPSDEKDLNLPEGSKGMQLKNQFIEIKAEEWLKHKEFKSLHTNVKNSMQHGQAWSEPAANALIDTLVQNKMVVVDYPEISAREGQRAKAEISHDLTGAESSFISSRHCCQMVPGLK